MNRLIQRSALALALAGSAGLAQAQGGFNMDTISPYVGAGVGYTKINDFCDGDDLLDCDDNDIGYKFFGGARITDFFGVEAGWVGLGEADYGPANIEADGLFLQGVGYLPLDDRFALFAKVGLFSWNADGKAQTGFGTIDSDEFDDSGTDPMGSIGAEAALTENVRIQVQYDRYFNLGDDDNDIDVDMLAVNGVFLF